VRVRTGAWLLIGIGCALVIITVLAVFVLPSGRRRQPSSISPRRLTMPPLKIPSGSPTGSLLKGFSYLYAPLSYARVHHSVAGRLERAIARIDAVDPSVVPERVGQALQQMVDLDSPTGSPIEGGEPVVDIFDQPRSEEQ
jgi:hypothetical protein